MAEHSSGEKVKKKRAPGAGRKRLYGDGVDVVRGVIVMDRATYLVIAAHCSGNFSGGVRKLAAVLDVEAAKGYYLRRAEKSRQIGEQIEALRSAQCLTVRDGGEWQGLHQRIVGLLQEQDAREASR